MKLTRAARTILSVTALAWAIPFAQADDKVEPGDGRETTISLDDHRAQAGAPNAAWPFRSSTEQRRD